MKARIVRTGAVALALASLAVTTGLAATRRFTFRDAEFMPPDEAALAVEAFLHDRLLAGMPLEEARRRLVAAGMTCRTGERRCVYAMPTHGDGGVIGEDAWTVRLSADAQAKLLSWSVDHDQPSSHL